VPGTAGALGAVERQRKTREQGRVDQQREQEGRGQALRAGSLGHVELREPRGDPSESVIPARK
jgi:hypothetical protein